MFITRTSPARPLANLLDGCSHNAVDLRLECEGAVAAAGAPAAAGVPAPAIAAGDVLSA